MKITSRAEARDSGLKQYFTGKPCINGHISPRRINNKDCVECCRARSRRNARRYSEERKEYHRKHYLENRDSQLAIAAEYRERNRESIRERARDYYYENRDVRMAANKAWRQANKDRHNENGNKWWREKYKSDPVFRAGWAARDYLRRSLNAVGFSKRGLKTFEMLGYTPEELKTHIEKQFTKGMSWDNYGDWHIDHIIPISEHAVRGETNPSVINCLTNLRPIWATDNLRKSARRTHLL